ncbi:hypothetical protein OH807_30130 [Kitasatospora sp. NBC_01560]|uniref:ABC transporter permease n=1 Tax=Kitasatospora sp. NBC_01560 TaxID=2975965 RepID=UPI00386D0307
MTGPATVSAASGGRTPHDRGRRPQVALARLSARLVRRGTVLLALAVAAYSAVEVFSYLGTYPDTASRSRLATLQDNPALRMLQGIPHAIDTPGGFVAWDGGWVLVSIVGIWALLTTGRLLRGEEESGRAELVLAGPLRAGRAVLVQLTVLACAIAVIGAAIAMVLTTAGTGAGGSVLFGLAVAGFAATFAGVAAITAQAFEVRRRATGAAAAVFGLMFLVRMLANSSDSRGWARWLTPFGWMDELHPYRDPRWQALAALLAVPVLLGAVAVRLRRARDTGGALLAEPDRRTSRARLLGGPAAFAWRSTRGALIGWVIGVAAYAFVIGSTLRTVTDLIADDPAYRKVLQALGWDAAQATKAYLGIMAVLIGLFLALYACWRIGAARTEEAAGRLDNTLARPVSRRRWLAGHLLLTVAATMLIAVAASLALWTGTAIGGADVGITDTLGSVLNTLPVAVLLTGVAVLLYGARPRLTVAASVAVAVTVYLVQLIGPALHWPRWVLDASPFHHLATVPAESFAPVSTVVMTGIGLALMTVGAAAFERRDLTGA